MSDHSLRAAQGRSCQNLWVAVLVQAMRDLFLSASENATLNRQRVRSWLKSRDFHMVCALARLDGEYIASQLERRFAQIAAGTTDPAELVRNRSGAGHDKPRISQRRVSA